MRNWFLKFSLAVLLVGGGFALAQSPLVPYVTNVGVSDAIQVIPGGTKVSAQSQYATAAQVSGVQGYHSFGTISGDPAYTVPNGVTNMFGHGASTISAVTITTEPNPGDGKRECYWADQTTTTLTWTANTGQSIDSNVPAAGVAKVSSCITYVASASKWYASN